MRLILAAAVAALVLPGAAQAQSALTLGQAVTNKFAPGDPKLSDGSSYRCYRLQTEAGRRYRIDMQSAEFDAFLAVGRGDDCGEMPLDAADDDSGTGTDAQVEISGNGGAWLIRANTLNAGESGAFTLTATDAGPSSAPSRGVRRIALGQVLKGELVNGDQQSDDDSYFDCYAFTLGQGERALLTMSADFDAFLQLHRGGTCDGETLDSNDDAEGSGGTNAQLKLSRAGTYSVRANSLLAGTTGLYALSLQSDEQ